ncbi:MAG: tetratricopeptide repeat protein [Pseudomonadota bacterium]
MKTRRRARSRLSAAAALGALALLAACDSAEERKVSHYENGLEFVEAGEPGKALIEFTNAIRIDDAFIPAHEGLGRLHMDQGRPGAAVRHLVRVAEARPEDLDTRLDLARVLLDLRNIEGARTYADAALALDAENPRGLGLRAALDLMIGEVETARAGAARALELDPAAELARLVAVAERLRADEPQEALTLIEAAPAFSDDAEVDSGLALVRIHVLEQLEDREGVGAALQTLAAARPEDAGLRLALARWHMQGDPPDAAAAETERRAAAELGEDPAQARLQVVDFLRRTQGDAAARAELEALIARAGGEGEEASLYERALAVAEIRAGERDAAVVRLEALMAREGDGEAGDAARLLLARVTEDGDRRAGLVEEVLENDSANVEALAMRAELSMLADRAGDAILDLRTALEGSPNNAALLELLARAHEREGDDALAAEQRARAVQASEAAAGPSLRYAEQLVRLGRVDSAEAVLLDSLRANSENRRLLTALAELRLRRQDWDGVRQVTAAIEALDARGESVAPAGGATELLRAAALFGEGRVDETLDMLRASWEERGGAGELEALIRAYLAANDVGAARETLEAALAESPDDLAALALLAEVQARAGEASAAEDTLRQALEQAPEAPVLRRMLSELLNAQGRLDESIEVLEAGLEARPDDPGLRFDKALRLELNGEIERAIALYERLYDEDPDNIVVANNLASLLSDHRTDEASLERAATVARRLRGSPLAPFQDTYGWTLYLTGEHAQAVAVLRDSAPRLPNNAIAQFHLGMAYAAIGQTDLAREQLTRALEISDAGGFFPQRSAAEEALTGLDAAEEAAESNG